jgi:hypothetical protein
MGRSYWFECGKCGFRAKVSGQADGGLHCFVQTVICHDCGELYDAVVRLRVPVEPCQGLPRPGGMLRPGNWGPAAIKLKTAPSFQVALNRLNFFGAKRLRWIDFKPQCPVSALHRVQAWNDPGSCPRCGLHMERSALPYRIWE